MKKHILLISAIFLSFTLSYSQLSRTFCKYKKVKSEPRITCTDNCAKIVLIYEEGTFINAIQAAIGIDSQFCVASEKRYFVEYGITPGVHNIMLPQGVLDANINNIILLCKDTMGFKKLCNADYEILLGGDVTDLKFNQLMYPCGSKMYMHQIYYLTYNRNFKAGEIYYYKAIKLPNGYSLACGPILIETTKEDFEKITTGEKIKGKSEVLVYEK